jgi:hypothetical protein
MLLGEASHGRDETQALRPLPEVKGSAEGEVPETYPSGV